MTDDLVPKWVIALAGVTVGYILCHIPRYRRYYRRNYIKHKVEKKQNE